MFSYALLAILILVVGVPAFWLAPAKWALAATTLLPPLLFQVFVWLELGHVDPFALVAFLVTAAISFLGAHLIRLGVRLWRDKRAKRG